MTTTKANTASPAPADEESESAEDRVPGFKVAGTIYTFPAHIPVGWGLTYLRLLYASSSDHALTWALMKLLGSEQYTRLEEDPALTRDHMPEISAALRDALLGGPEDPKA
jgi:hypothetical protein